MRALKLAAVERAEKALYAAAALDTQRQLRAQSTLAREAEALGPRPFDQCVCGHPRHEHTDDDATWNVCGAGCDCTWFRLSAV